MKDSPGRAETGSLERRGSDWSFTIKPLSSSTTLSSCWDSLKAIMSSMKGKACLDMKQPWKVLHARLPVDNLAKFMN